MPVDLALEKWRISISKNSLNKVFELTDAPYMRPKVEEF